MTTTRDNLLSIAPVSFLLRQKAFTPPPAQPEEERLAEIAERLALLAK